MPCAGCGLEQVRAVPEVQDEEVERVEMTVINIPLLVVGRGLNDRTHWATRAKHNKRERGAVCWAFARFGLDGGKLPEGPYQVTLIRVYSGRERELDDDNWIGAAKAVRDQVAAELHVNDGNKNQIRFTYAQEKGVQTAVRIEVNGTPNQVKNDVAEAQNG